MIGAALAAIASIAATQTAPVPAPVVAAPPAAPAVKEDLVKIAIETGEGRMVVALDRGRAPVTVANFLHYVDTHRYDGQTFYRAMPYGDGGLVQAGVTGDARQLFPPIAHEPTTKTGLHHVRGTLAMARMAPGSARSDFFILTADIPGFDAGAEGGDKDGFAAFGHVVEGIEVADKIFRDPKSPTKGAGAMKGQMLDPPVKIVRMTRVK